MNGYGQNQANAKTQSKEQYVDIKMGKHNLFSKKIYDIFCLVNDVLLGIWFLVGSVFFYFEALKHWGVTLFVLGSLQMLIRPLIRLIDRLHMCKAFGDQYEEGNR